MPQFETTYLVSQIFWLVVSFGVLYLGVHFIAFPMFRDIFSMRQSKVENSLNRAESLTQKAQNLEEEFIQKKQLQEKHFHQRIMLAQEKGQQNFQTIIEQNEKDLLKVLQKNILRMEREEKVVLKQIDAFIMKAQKGKI